MTREEFIIAYNIGHRDGKIDEYLPCDYPEFIEQEPCDAVSRKAAIDACLKGLNRKEMVANIKSLPSVHPECTEDYCPAAFKPVECEDCVSRQAVIEMAYDLSEIDGEHFTEPRMVVDVEDIQNAPPVTPAEKIGHWIKTIGENGVTSAVRCSECGFEDNRYMLFRYCPNCGSFNGGEQDGSISGTENP